MSGVTTSTWDHKESSGEGTHWIKCAIKIDTKAKASLSNILLIFSKWYSNVETKSSFRDFYWHSSFFVVFFFPPKWQENDLGMNSAHSGLWKPHNITLLLRRKTTQLILQGTWFQFISLQLLSVNCSKHYSISLFAYIQTYILHVCACGELRWTQASITSHLTFEAESLTEPGARHFP